MNRSKLIDTYKNNSKFYKSTRNSFSAKLNDDVIDIIKAKIYKEMPTTDNITFSYATPVSIDLTGIVVEVSSGLSDEEKNVISKKLNEYFAGNKINRNVYKSKIGCVIIDANPSKILNVTIPNLPEVTLIGETSYARPNFGAITYSIV